MRWCSVCCTVSSVNDIVWNVGLFWKFDFRSSGHLPTKLPGEREGETIGTKVHSFSFAICSPCLNHIFICIIDSVRIQYKDKVSKLFTGCRRSCWRLYSVSTRRLDNEFQISQDSPLSPVYAPNCCESLLVKTTWIKIKSAHIFLHYFHSRKGKKSWISRYWIEWLCKR